jgi:hypothetical protein
MYIRDIRSPFPAPPRWKATNNLLDEFIAENGSAWFVNREEAAMLYALSRLRFDVVAGDITTEDGRMITFEQLEHFIAARLSGENTQAFRPVDEYLLKNVIKKRPEIVKTETFHPDGVISSVIEILKDAPAALLQVDVLAKKLSEIREDAISTESLISLLGEKKDVFLILRAKDGVIVKLKMEWYAKQKSHRF